MKNVRENSSKMTYTQLTFFNATWALIRKVAKNAKICHFQKRL